MKTIFNLFYLLGLLATVRLDVSAAPAPAVYSFRVMSWDDEITDLKIADDATKSTDIAMRPNGRSPFYHYKGPQDQPLVFFREKQNAKGETYRELAASVPLTQLLEHSLLMFFARTSAQPGAPISYNVKVIDDSPKALGPGSYNFMNFTRASMAVTCGVAHGVVVSNQSVVLAGKPAGDSTITSIEIYAQESKDISKRIYSNRWPYDNNTRTNVFVFQEPETNEYLLKRIQESSAIMTKHTAELLPAKSAAP